MKMRVRKKIEGSTRTSAEQQVLVDEPCPFLQTAYDPVARLSDKAEFGQIDTQAEAQDSRRPKNRLRCEYSLCLLIAVWP